MIKWFCTFRTLIHAFIVYYKLIIIKKKWLIKNKFHKKIFTCDWLQDEHCVEVFMHVLQDGSHLVHTPYSLTNSSISQESTQFVPFKNVPGIHVKHVSGLFFSQF